MVDTILSDKTGTLTRNIMEFFKCSIGGVAYGQGVTEIEKSNARRLGTDPSKLQGECDPEAAVWRQPAFNFYDRRLLACRCVHMGPGARPGPNASSCGTVVRPPWHGRIA